MLLKILNYSSRQPHHLVAIACLFFTICVGSIDYITGYELDVEILYFIPIFFASISLGKYSGLLISVISAIVSLIIDLALTPHHHQPAIIYWNSFIYLLTAIFFSFLSSALATSVKRETRVARIDFLTGIVNRMGFVESLNIEIQRCRRNAQCLTIGYLDCDNFKTINDQLGHQTGDQLLSSVAEILKSSVRATDIVARLGGDEFAILLPNTCTDLTLQIFDRLQNMLTNEMKQHQWAVTFSIGIAIFNVVPDSIDEIIHCADDLMYKVKKSGKGRFEYKTFN
jgi:diguanylate cyclase (GGDEF)-like protein